MTKWIIGSVVAGLVAGRLFITEAFTQNASTFSTVGLCIILFMVGIDMGRQGGILKEMKAAGLRIFIIPFGIIVGSLGFGALASAFLPLTVQDTVAVSAGFGWYSLSPMLLADYSATVSAVAFLANLMREVSAIILIPIVAQRMGYCECIALPGAAAMDSLLPVVVGVTHQRMAIYSLVTGVILSSLVPILIPLIVSF